MDDEAQPIADTEPLDEASGAADDIEHETAKPSKEDLGKRAKKRIGELTWKAHEAERRALAMEQRARMLEAKLQEAHGSANTFYTKNLEKEIEAAEGDYARAVNEGDAMAQAKALRKLSEATSKKSAAQQWQAQPQPVPQAQIAPQPQVSPKMQAWLHDNLWYLNDKIMAQAALAVHQDAVRRGVQPESDEYFGLINKRMRAAFPDNFADDEAEDAPAEEAQTKPVQQSPRASVAPVHRSTAAPSRPTTGRLPRLTAEQQSVARMLGISNEAYAAQLPRS